MWGYASNVWRGPNQYPPCSFKRCNSLWQSDCHHTRIRQPKVHRPKLCHGPRVLSFPSAVCLPTTGKWQDHLKRLHIPSCQNELRALAFPSVARLPTTGVFFTRQSQTSLHIFKLLTFILIKSYFMFSGVWCANVAAFGLVTDGLLPESTAKDANHTVLFSCTVMN